MSILAALGLGLLIGAVLGGLGGAGGVLAVPALVYLLGQTAQQATTSSLVIVGLTALIGVAGHARSGHVRWRTGIALGVAGIVAAFAGTALNRRVDEPVLLLGFSAVMILAAAGMLINAHRSSPDHGQHPNPTAGPNTATTVRIPERTSGAATAIAQLACLATVPVSRREQSQWRGRTVLVVKVVLAGLTVGFLTGFFGVGGGFVIVPALVLLLGLPMPAAVGTSLLVIVISSAASLAARAGQAHFDWAVIIPFTIAAMASSLAGKAIADRLPEIALNRAFAFLLLAVAVCLATTQVS